MKKSVHYLVKSECDVDVIKLMNLGYCYFCPDNWERVVFESVKEIRIPLDIDLMLDMQLGE